MWVNNCEEGEFHGVFSLQCALLPVLRQKLRDSVGTCQICDFFDRDIKLNWLPPSGRLWMLKAYYASIVRLGKHFQFGRRSGHQLEVAWNTRRSSDREQDKMIADVYRQRGSINHEQFVFKSKWNDEPSLGDWIDEWVGRWTSRPPINK